MPDTLLVSLEVYPSLFPMTDDLMTPTDERSLRRNSALADPPSLPPWRRCHGIIGIQDLLFDIALGRIEDRSRVMQWNISRWRVVLRIKTRNIAFWRAEMRIHTGRHIVLLIYVWRKGVLFLMHVWMKVHVNLRTIITRGVSPGKVLDVVLRYRLFLVLPFFLRRDGVVVGIATFYHELTLLGLHVRVLVGFFGHVLVVLALVVIGKMDVLVGVGLPLVGFVFRLDGFVGGVIVGAAALFAEVAGLVTLRDGRQRSLILIAC